MQRQRIEFDGAVYHVTQRSSNREKIFGNELDKQFFIDLLLRYKGKLDFRVFGFVIMDNHYHLLLQTGTIPLNKVMHRINFLFSRYYNQKHDRHGHVFGGRYKAALIQEEKYLFAVLRYIHQNPVRAGLSKRVSDFKWSSDAIYRQNHKSIIDIDFILGTFSRSREEAIKIYRQMMNEKADTDYERKDIIGDDEFIKTHMTESSNHGRTRKSLDDLLNNCSAGKEEIDLIRKGSRKRVLRDYKRKYAIDAVEEGYTLKQIGIYINISDAAINKLISK